MSSVALGTTTEVTGEAAPAAIAPWERLLGVVAAGAGVLLPTVISPVAQSQTFAPKYALLIVMTAVGAVPLAKLARASRYAWQARAGIAFILVAVVSAAVSSSKLVGFFGLYLWGEGAIFLAALVSAWAIGTCLGPTGRSWLYRGLVAGAALNAVAALAQTTLNLNTATADLSGFGLFNGTQADGMMGNPVHLEAILLGALALVLGRTCRRPYPSVVPYAVLVAVLAGGLECSSERYAVIVVALLAAYAIVVYRKRSVAYLVALAAGFGGALVAGAGVSLGQRLSTSSASTTFGLRFHAAAQASIATLEHRPLLGFGPGEMRTALELYQTPSFAKLVPAGKYFTDVHDLLANILVMTGIVGFLLFAAFFFGTTWRARGAFAGYAAASLLVALAEPMNVGVTPLAFLALGAALASSRGPAWDGPPPERARPALAAAVLGALALVPAVVLVVGDVVEHSAVLHYSLSEAKLANTLLPIWPQTANELIDVYNYDAVTSLGAASRTAFEEARSWAGQAASRDPSDNENWLSVGRTDIDLGDVQGALSAGIAALTKDPYGADALSYTAFVEARSGNWAASIAYYQKALLVTPGSQTVETDLKAAEARDTGFFDSNSPSTQTPP